MTKPFTHQAPRLEVRHLRKVYPGTVALDDVSIVFEPGKVHALLGRNGAGKSTLIKIISGATSPTQGAVLIDGRDVALKSPQDAMRAGVATVYQELSLVPGLTVAENILFGRLPRRFGLIDWPATYRQAGAVLERMGIAIDVRQRVGQLGVAQQQVIEIAKAVSHEPAALLLDEPTSALSNEASEALFGVVRRLAGSGVAVIYISHRLQELKAIVDTVSVLRDGKLVRTLSMADASPRAIAELMFGPSAMPERRELPAVSDRLAMRVTGLTRSRRFSDVSFEVKQGEVLGIAGMVGAGRTSLLMSLFGADPVDAGEIEIGGHRVHKPTPQRMKTLGVGLTPEKRKEQGVVLAHSIRENLSLAGLKQIGWHGWITRAKQAPVVARAKEALSIKWASPSDAIASLSGGNQQKCVVGKWLPTHPRLLLLDEPTRGVDVHAKQQIFDVVHRLASQGIGCVFVSSEFEELLEVCHRVLVMRGGRIAEEVDPGTVTLGDLFEKTMEQA